LQRPFAGDTFDPSVKPVFLREENFMPTSFRICIATLVAVVAIGAFAFAQDSDKKDEMKPKHTVKQVMGKAMAPKGDKLNKKVLSGDASDQEKLELLDLFISLTENDAPSGDQDSWNKFTSTAAMAAAKVAVGRDGAMDELKAATNCKKCHDAHKPKKK
jgi:pentapeptide MXKDX repeat protein